MRKWVKPTINVIIIAAYYYLAYRHPSDILTVAYALIAWNRIIEKLLELLGR